MSDQPNSFGWGRAFDRFFPWLVAGVVTFAGMTGRFQATESQSASTAAEVQSLKTELKAVRWEMTDLRRSVDRLSTVLELGGPAAAPKPSAARRRPRQFDH
jgi:hypothetical protein